eukprot:maker-scaffold_11-snap-gene-4.45-mRNA-1 protein AED:0.49 eAED:0.61 QI:0/0/0/0.75/0/0/4/0/280
MSNNIRDELVRLQDQVFDNVKLQRNRESSRRNKNRVLESISENANVELYTVHVYGSIVMPNKQKKSYEEIILHNFSSLELDRRRPRYKLEVKWLGFNSSENTFQDLIALYEDLPLLVPRFIMEEVKDEYTKEAFLQLLREHDKNEETKKSKKKGKPKRKNIVRYLKKTNFAIPSSGNTVGWYEEEKDILAKLILKYGCGKYDDYLSLPYLPFRSKQQMSTQIQRMLNIQSIGIFHGLRFEVKVAQRFLEDVLGITSFHKNLPGKFNMLQEKNKILEQFKS